MIYHYYFANDFTWPFSSACEKQIILSWMVYNEHVLIFHGCTVNQEAWYGKLLSWSLDSGVHIMTLGLAFDVLYRIINFDTYWYWAYQLLHFGFQLGFQLLLRCTKLVHLGFQFLWKCVDRYISVCTVSSMTQYIDRILTLHAGPSWKKS